MEVRFIIEQLNRLKDISKPYVAFTELETKQLFQSYVIT
jgi:hypothetical protein